MQQALAILFVLGLLAGALWLLRSKGLVRGGGMGLVRSGSRRMQAVERLALTPQHSLHLVSVAGKVLLIGVSPGGCAVLADSIAPEASPSRGEDR
ncbi:MAG TPA: flagellar biosynthetic protein FliO [Bryobacteraceae bacterium]|nr:flagellar biosynthetic protein FliO [Bryobacteraceae bacterium]